MVRRKSKRKRSGPNRHAKQKAATRKSNDASKWRQKMEILQLDGKMLATTETPETQPEELHKPFMATYLVREWRLY